MVHLKRFNDLGNNKWVKSQKVVHFPYQDFDPTPYLASVPQETILRHNDLNALKHSRTNNTININNNNNCDIPESCDEDDQSTEMDEDEQRRRRRSPSPDEENGNSCSSATNSGATTFSHDDLGGGSATLERRKRLISTSLTKTPVIDDELIDYHRHRLKKGSDEFDLKYKLYAVVVSRDIADD